MLTDSLGGKWDFRPTIGALRRFERRTEIRLFSRIGKALPEDLASMGKGVDGKTATNLKPIIDVFTSVIDGFDSAAALLYECRIWAGDDPAPKPTFDEFCELFAVEKVSEALMQAIEILTQCVSGVASAAPISGADPESERPFSDGSTPMP